MVVRKNLVEHIHTYIDGNNVPKHVAVVMDGNGRWAKRRALPRSAGHKAGALAAEKFVKTCFEYGVEYVTLFAFSSENWHRPSDEVNDLMSLFRRYLRNDLQKLTKEDVRIRFIGDFTQLDEDILEMMENITESTAHHGKNLTIAMSYGGRLDICQAVKRIVCDYKHGDITLNSINHDLINQYLMTSELPEPDLFIRTSGEYRISNFLLWQIAYSELYFTPKFWPEFRREDLYEAIIDFQRRERRFGKTSEQIVK